jgi:hypothetical protein
MAEGTHELAERRDEWKDDGAKSLALLILIPLHLPGCDDWSHDFYTIITKTIN